jgi:ubiquinone/menaquinone biosynthesis C-methylase UbiE
MPASPYNRIADWYNELVRTAWGDHEQTLPELGDLIGDIRGKEVCDLACGQGSITRWLARSGEASRASTSPSASWRLRYGKRSRRRWPSGTYRMTLNISRS